MTDAFKKIVDIIVDVADIPAETIKEDSLLIDDLDLASLEILSIVSKIEEEFYFQYPNLRNQNIAFFVNGNEINRTATIEENEIKNGDVILVKDV